MIGSRLSSPSPETDNSDQASFSPLDLHFGALLQKLSGTGDPIIGLTGALASHAVQNGHSCLDLSAYEQTPVRFDNNPYEIHSWPPLADWLRALTASPVVAQESGYAPLILVNRRLYLHRYHSYEQQIIAAVRERVTAPPDAFEPQRVRDLLSRVFPQGTPGTDRQMLAAATAAGKKLVIISGGPGTGKTYAVMRILSLLALLRQDRKPRIALAAPTGKAALRLEETIRSHGAGLAMPAGDADTLSLEATTIHSLLGPISGSPYFRHNRSNPLPFDVVVIDEASMMDQALAAKLFDALLPQCRLILLGDRDQLASVEAGAVFGDLCDSGNEHGYTRFWCDTLRSVMPECGLEAKDEPPLADSIIILAKNYRFDHTSGIGELCGRILAGDIHGVGDILSSSRYPDCSWWIPPSHAAMIERLDETALCYWSDYFQSEDPFDALNLFNRCRVLCAVRKGPFGVTALNTMIEHLLAARSLIPARTTRYKRKPVLITHNDYALGLYNGDTGVFFPDPEDNGTMKVFFSSARKRARSFAPHRLPAFEPAYAVTVHKAQGSEFDRTIVILPPRPAAVATRELLYTALTRARSGFELWCGEEALAAALASSVSRASGMREALWKSRNDG
ncbi:MAG: exodeoxyribonuclease V subunit alpha [Chitinispirillaceae bacterium]|nr:exodeoxyribonuclease V subunit alpha [Chitinispirillaceae bacterium]